MAISMPITWQPVPLIQRLGSTVPESRTHGAGPAILDNVCSRGRWRAVRDCPVPRGKPLSTESGPDLGNTVI